MVVVFFAEKTRGKKDSCYGDLRPLKDALARSAGTPSHTKVCLEQLRSIEKDNRCSCTLSETHSQKLSAIPGGMYEHLVQQGENNINYRSEDRNGATNAEQLGTVSLSCQP